MINSRNTPMNLAELSQFNDSFSIQFTYQQTDDVNENFLMIVNNIQKYRKAIQ